MTAPALHLVASFADIASAPYALFDAGEGPPFALTRFHTLAGLAAGLQALRHVGAGAPLGLDLPGVAHLVWDGGARQALVAHLTGPGGDVQRDLRLLVQTERYETIREALLAAERRRA